MVECGRIDMKDGKIVGIYVLKLVDCKYNPLTDINKVLLL